MLRIPVVEYEGQVLQEGNIDFITLTETYNQNEIIGNAFNLHSIYKGCIIKL